MYTAVVMAALLAGDNSVDCGRGRGGCGCYGYGGGYGWGYARGWGGYGGYGWGGYGWGGYGRGWGGYGYVAAPAVSTAPATALASTPTQSEAVAHVIVNLPADAKLYVDGHETKAKSAQREFVTPELDRGRSYSYTLRAEVVREGRTIRATKRISVQPGQVSEATFENLKPVATARAER